MKPPNPQLNRTINRWAARIIPSLLVGIVGYTTWVEIALIGVNHLIHGDDPGSGIAIIVIHIILLLLCAAAFFQVIHVISADPGFVPLPTSDSSLSKEKDSQNLADEKFYLDRAAVHTGAYPTPAGLENYYIRDAFECEIDGLPRWCSSCKNWKPDRSHHCSEVGRCVYKMDHFCPWAGGIISENNFKFFIQFVFYASLYCLFVLLVNAYYISRARGLHGSEANWAVAIGLYELFERCNILTELTPSSAAFFFIFTGSMTFNSTRFACLNTTTVDSLTRSARQFNFAVLVSDGKSSASPDLDTRLSRLSSKYNIITFPLRTPASNGVAGADGTGPSRTFVVLPVPIGGNPYNQESFVRNFCTVMGDHWYDWFLPIRMSPCFYRRLRLSEIDPEAARGETLYEMGPVLAKMLQEIEE